MASSNPIPAYSRDPAEATFHRALQYAHPAWIHGFLYPSPAAHFDHLRRALLQPRRIIAIFSIATLVPSGAPSLNESKHCLLFPSISMGSLSLMYHISEHVKSDISTHKSPYITRCARDDEHGIFFKLSELETGLTEIMLLVQRSPGVREHIFLVVATEHFRVVMDTLAKGGAYNQTLMQQSLIYTMRILQTRSCPSCGTRAICDCSLQITQKRYPVDFDRDLLNLTSYNGGYDGVCYQAIHEGGVNLGSWVSSVGVSAMFSFDEHKRQKLESWGMWHTLQGRENILKTVIPSVTINTPHHEDAGGRQDTAGEGFSAIAEGHDLLPGASSSYNFDVPPAVPKEYPIAGNIPENEFPEQGNSDGVSVPHSYFPPAHAEPSLVLPEIHEDVRSKVCRDSDISSHGHISATAVQTDALLTHMAEQSQISHQAPAASPSSLPPVHQSLSLSANREKSAPVHKDSVSRRKRMGRPPSSKARGVSRLLPIVPATQVTGVDGDTGVNAIPDETTIALALRKTRNRESAARSDERKKKSIQALENNLEEARKREDALREQIQELMEANLALRMRLQK